MRGQAIASEIDPTTRVKKELRILFVEDLPADVGLVNHELHKLGRKFRTKRVESKEVFLREIERRQPDLILSDHGLPGFDGFAALAIAKSKCPGVPFIFVTNSCGEELAIETFESGATDYVLKSNLAKLAPAVKRALVEAQERTRLRQKEQALRESENRLRMVIEGVKDYAIYMLDPNGRVATWNKGAERIKGYKAREIIGRPFTTFFPPEDVKNKVPEASLERAARLGRARNEGWRVRKDGSRFWSQGIITALRDEAGQLRGFAKVAHDMTRQKEAEEEIQRLNSELEARVLERTKQLEAANQNLEAFNYSVSHDLRAPLRHILGYVDILRTNASSPLNKEQRQLLQTIAKSAAQMGKMIDTLLKFSKMGRAEMHFKRVNLAALVKDARNELHDEIKGREIDWQIGDLPKVRGDPIMLRQAVVNLLSNAVKYTRTRPKAKIEIWAKDEGSETIFFVRDNGVGFDMNYASKLFGVFQRFHPASAFEGTGIGLANVRSIIHRHGGRAWGEGKVDAGATFYFSIPKTPEAK